MRAHRPGGRLAAGPDGNADRLTGMRMSELFVRTLREDPADADVVSHRLLARAGYVRRVAPGVYSWLSLGLRVLHRVETIVREDMNVTGAQEVRLPALLSREPYTQRVSCHDYA